MSAPVFNVSANGAKRMVLRQGNLYVPLPAAILAGWDTIRLTMLFKPEQSTRPQIGAETNLFFGLSSGTTAGFNDGNTTHCVGTKLVHHVATTWGYFPGPPDSWQIYNCACTKVGSTFTEGANYQNLITLFPGSEGGIERYSLLMLEIDKGSPNYVISSRLRQTVNAVPSRMGMECVAATCAEGKLVAEAAYMSAWGSANGTLAVNEAGNGTLDHIHLSFDRDYLRLYVDGIAVRKIS